MPKTFEKKANEVERNAEKVNELVSWRLSDAYIDKESGDVAVDVLYFIHDGKSDKGQFVFFYDRDEFSPTLRVVDKLDENMHILEIHKISAMRDAQSQMFNYKLRKYYEDNMSSGYPSRNIHDLLFDKNDEHYERFRNVVKVETLMNLVKRPSVFYSEELRELFA